MQSIIMIIIEELQSLIKQTQSIEALYLQEIIALQKITNFTHKSIKQTIPNHNIKKEIQKKEQIPDINVEQKINDLINHIQNKQKNIQNNIKTIVQVKPQPIVEKKPPLPVINKQNKNIKSSAPVYVPPRNQNQVTPKVTQTILRTSGTKVFKPQKTTAKRSESKQKIKQKDIKVSVQKVQKQQTKIAPKIEFKDMKSMEKQVIKFQSLKNQVKSQIKPITSKKQTQIIKKIQKIVNFHKPFEQILQSLIGNNKANHKPQLKKLLLQYQNEQKGYKMHEETNRNNLIRKINNYALSKHRVNSSTTHQIIRRKWNYHDELFIYQQLLHNLDKEITNLQQLKDCRIDPKQQYRLKKSLQTYSNRVDEIIQQSKQVPNKIDLSFNYTPINTQSNHITPQTTFQNIHQIKVHQQLLKLLQELAGKGSLQKKDMRCLQVLGQIAIFKSKRCPNIILSKDYEKWKNYYQ